MCWVIGSAAFSVERLKRFSKGSKRTIEFVFSLGCLETAQHTIEFVFSLGFLETTPNTRSFLFFFVFFLKLQFGIQLILEVFFLFKEEQRAPKFEKY